MDWSKNKFPWKGGGGSRINIIAGDNKAFDFTITSKMSCIFELSIKKYNLCKCIYVYVNVINMYLVNVPGMGWVGIRILLTPFSRFAHAAISRNWVWTLPHCPPFILYVQKKSLIFSPARLCWNWKWRNVAGTSEQINEYSV